MATQARYYPRNTVIPVVIPKKSCFCQEGKKPWRYIQIFTKPWPLSCPNRLLSVVQRTSLGSYWEGSEVRVKVSPSEQKKKFFGAAALFLFFFFSGLFFGFLFPHLSVVCLSHLVFMPQTWHMPSPYPHPSIHVSNLTNPCVHTVLSPPKLTVLCFVSPFPGWGGQGDTACVTIVHSECWKRYFSTPPSLPYYTFLSSYLFVSLCRCLF